MKNEPENITEVRRLGRLAQDSFRDRQRERGLERVEVWVPMLEVDTIRQMAADLRETSGPE